MNLFRLSHFAMRSTVLLVLTAAGTLSARTQEPAPIPLTASNCILRVQLDSTWGPVNLDVKKFTGSLRFGRPGDLNTLQGGIEIDANSLTSTDAGRDKKMRETCLDPTRFPKITFTVEKSTRFEGQSLVLSGQLTVRDVTRPFVIGVQYDTEENICHLVGGGELKWVDYGVRNFKSTFSELQPSVRVVVELKLVQK